MNELAIKKDGKILRPKARFTIGRGNQPVYEIIEPLDWRQKNNIPKRINLKGTWSLDKKNGLVFELKKTETQSFLEQLTLKAGLKELRANALVFSLVSRGCKTHSLKQFQLKGRWQADKYNRLNFLVKRLNASDTLVFQGGWQVKNNSLVYTYKKGHRFYFKGYWQISKPNRLTYILDRKNNSYFDFRVYLETPNLIGKHGAVKYRAGIGIKEEIITLYGVWKLHRKTGISLVLQYNDKRLRAISFKAFARVKKGNKITFELKNSQNRDLGISLTLSKSFLSDNAEWFLRAIQEGRHRRLEWGIAIAW